MEDDAARSLASKVASDATQLAVVTATTARDLAVKTAEGMAGISQRLQEHTASDELNFQKIRNDLSAIKDNHLYHIEKDVSNIASSVASLHEKLDENNRETTENKTNLGWVVKIGGGAWAVALVLFASMVYIVREALTK